MLDDDHLQAFDTLNVLEYVTGTGISIYTSTSGSFIPSKKKAQVYPVGK